MWTLYHLNTLHSVQNVGDEKPLLLQYDSNEE